jgi:hypothetical protein
MRANVFAPGFLHATTACDIRLSARVISQMLPLTKERRMARGFAPHFIDSFATELGRWRANRILS